MARSNSASKPIVASGAPRGVVHARRVERLLADLHAPRVPLVDRALRHRAPEQASQPSDAALTEPMERDRRRCAAGDVIGVSCDAVEAEREYHVGALVGEHVLDATDELLERHVREGTVRVSEPLVAIGRPSEGGPRAPVLLLADLAERRPRGERRIGDLARFPAGRVHEHEPERGILGVASDGGGTRVGVVVGVGDDHGEPLAHVSSSSGSSPTVRPGRVGAALIASSTPGMNDVRSVES